MNKTLKKIQKIAKDREFEEADAGSLAIALSNMEVAAAIENQEKRLKKIESSLDDINKSLQELLKTYYDIENAKSRGISSV